MLIVAKLFKGPSISASDILFTLEQLQSEGVPFPKVFHADQGAAYISAELSQFANQHHILLSFDAPHGHSGAPQAFGNQVAESFNSIIDYYLDIRKTDKQSVQNFLKKSYSEQNFLIQNVVHSINLRKNRDVQYREYNPTELYNALMEAAQELKLLVKNKTKEAYFIQIHHESVVMQQDAVNSIETIKQHNFVLYNQSLNIIQNLIKERRKAAETGDVRLLEAIIGLFKHYTSFIISQLRVITLQNVQLQAQLRRHTTMMVATQDEVNNLKSLNEMLRDEISNSNVTIQNEQNERKQKELEKEQKKKKRQLRTKKPLRDIFSQKDILQILKSVNYRPIKRSRVVIGIVLLKLYGWRVSQLLTLTAQDLEHLAKGKKISVELIKANNVVKQPVPSSDVVVAWLKAFPTELKMVLQNRHPVTNFVFPYSRETLTRNINTVLKGYSLLTSKNFRSHSFRITKITEIIHLTKSIVLAQQTIGHADIRSTQAYNRFTMPEELYKTLLDTANLMPTDSGEVLMQDKEGLLVTAVDSILPAVRLANANLSDELLSEYTYTVVDNEEGKPLQAVDLSELAADLSFDNENQLNSSDESETQ
uniref:Uncharacterized protein n=1 Tax=Uronema confervicola TaxID=764120 RepID=A0A6H1U949_9CHLO|nr:hypothetical protein [Uronema confervicola]QIZ74189.1 hypothetical protein [Uronema confervicola]